MEIPTAEDFILQLKHDGAFTREELDNNWDGLPPTISEICTYMKEFAIMHVLEFAEKKGVDSTNYLEHIR